MPSLKAEESFMSETTLDQVIQEVRGSPPGLQRQLRDKLNEWLEKDETGKELDRVLMEDGLLTEIPLPVANFTPWQNRQPIQVEGQPLSETITEERGSLNLPSLTLISADAALNAAAQNEGLPVDDPNLH